MSDVSNKELMQNKGWCLVLNNNMRAAILFTLFLIINAELRAADFKGAAEVLRQASQTSPKAKEKKEDPSRPFRDKLKAFEKQSTNLPPGQAASQWLALVDEFENLSGDSMDRFRGGSRFVLPLQFNDVLKAIPQPSAWGELEKAVEARPAAEARAKQKKDLGLRLIAHTLTGNSARRAEDLKALDAIARETTGPEGNYEFVSIFQTLNEAILATMDDPEAILRMLESQLTASDESPMDLRVPNLVVLVGPAKAEEFFRKAFKTSRSVELEPGTPTHRLAVKIALELVEQMPKPQWSLINSLDTVELYEALDKKFNPAKKQTAESPGETGFFGANLPPGGFRQEGAQAKLYYFLGLIARDRIEDAIKIAKEFDRNNSVYFPPTIIKQMERAGLTQQLNTFFVTLLKDMPESPFWGEYVRVAAHAGHANDALQLVRAASGNKELSNARRAELRALLPAALLANDDVEAGIAELRVSATNRQPVSRSSYYSLEGATMGGAALQIARIGKLLDRKEWIEEGIATAKQKLEENSDDESASWNNPGTELAEFLSELGRGPEAEEVLSKALNKVQAKTQPPRQSFEDFGGDRRGAAGILSVLLKTYYQAGRFEDAVALLDQAEDWGMKDLLDLQKEDPYELGGFSFGSQHSVPTPLTFYAASALAKVGKKKEAAATLNYLLRKEPGLDRLYELLLELEPTNAVAKLDELFTRDQFEERPLIWKAHWLRTQGNLEEAETAARKAISIDPSDGEEGPNDRMRAYAELAEIRAARGDRKEADFFRGAVAAIRESEMADRLHEVGLLKRAVKMYQDSLNHFADAYCIQSRLAIQLADLGMHQEAEEHYRKAYELMPESFGRVESHCFGCERAFEGERAQSIADKVFTQLAQKTPDKPQVHYLLGYLREEQERPKEALDHYRTAVKLDSDYLNAWKKIAEISSKTVVPTAERDIVVFNLLRLDSNHRHVSYSFNTVSDLATLWTRVAETKLAMAKYSEPTTLYPLAASKRKLEEKSELNGQEEAMQMREQLIYMRSEAREGLSTPASAVIQNGFIQAGAALYGNSRGILD
jgi:tetratricopeptide (TPR) repeat protein